MERDRGLTATDLARLAATSPARITELRAIGVLVPHFHHRPHIQERSYCAPPVWIGFQPSSNGTGAVSLGGRF